MHCTAPVVFAYFEPSWYEHGTHVACPDRELEEPTSHCTHSFASPAARYDPGAHGSHTPNTVMESIVVVLDSFQK